ncbi:MAG TPA: hypothetical protein VN238_22200 [Solirubrobacteraceae bacterium]|nr:hypothetical protein [Solirubrobacteraceae bacterium]
MTRHRPALLAAVLVGGASAGLAAAPAVSAPRVAVHGTAKLLDRGVAELRQTGTFSGAPLGSGRLDGRAKITGERTARMTIALRGSKGFLRASGTVTVRVKGTTLSYTGTAKVSSVDGGARGLKGRVLRLRGTGDLVGNRFAVDLTG